MKEPNIPEVTDSSKATLGGHEILPWPKGYNPQEHLKTAFREIQNYVVTFVVIPDNPQEKRVVASGILATIGGLHGFLTAHHVASEVLKNVHFGLCFSQNEHGVFPRSEYCHHIEIGRPVGEYGESGPDISFIAFRDPKILPLLKAVKSFYSLDKAELSLLKIPLDCHLIAVSGSPFEKAERMTANAATGELWKYESFVGEATFIRRYKQQNFDYLQISMSCSGGVYPRDFKGMSGGGVWIIPFSSEGDPKTIRHEKPILIGVSFYQSDANGEERIIVSHGFDSIYLRGIQEIRKYLDGT